MQVEDNKEVWKTESFHAYSTGTQFLVAVHVRHEREDYQSVKSNHKQIDIHETKLGKTKGNFQGLMREI